MPIGLDERLRLLLATALCAAVGYQREKIGNPAGFRTHALICLGAALFTIVSTQAFGAGADPSRVSAGIVTGIGFLGAGAIMHRHGGMIEGLTTAATIWSVAAVGVAVGIGMYLVSVAAAVIILIVLFLPHPNRPA